MQTSVRSEAPRPADINSFSGESVRVSREVSVISSQAATPANLHPTTNKRLPAEFTPGITSITAPRQLNRWNSKVSDISWRHSRGLVPRPSQDAALLDTNRESMKALSDFLKTKEPPPNNFMSIPSDDEKSITSLKRTAAKLFGKRKKTTRSPRLVRLPDSAVAARTSSGARHIAISIPMEHDPSRSSTAPQPPNPLRAHPPIKTDRGAVAVLGSVAEVTSGRRSEDEIGNDGHQSTGRRSQGEHRSLDATMIMSAYHPDSNATLRQSRAEQRLMRYDTQRSKSSHVAGSPTETNQLENQRPDIRHSASTIYSQMSLSSTRMGHSRNISSVSTAPSATLITSLQLNLPPRSSSISKIPKVAQRELAIASQLGSEIAVEDLQLSPSKYSESTRRSPSPPAFYGIAVRGYNASPVGRPQVVRNMTSRSYAHASMDLPSPPEGREGFIHRPSTAPPPITRHPTVPRSKEPVRRSSSNRDGTTESILVTRQSRQERVRARKLRDLDSVRSQAGPRRPLSESMATSAGQNPSHVVAPPQHPKRGLNSSNVRRRATVHTLSPIMLVADLPPYTGHVKKIDLAPERAPKKVKSNSPESRMRNTHTPPRSTATSFDSDTDAGSPTFPDSKRRFSTPSLPSSVPETRRRSHHNTSPRTREMDARMSKIEKDNVMLLQTLSGIARSFGEISRIGKQSMKEEKRTGRLLSDEEWKPTPEEKRRRGELEKLEPVMREMAILAPSVSMEIHNLRRGNGHGDESDDARSLLG